MACLWAVIAYRMRHQTIFQEKANFGEFYDIILIESNDFKTLEKNGNMRVTYFWRL